VLVDQIAVIKALFQEAERRGIRLWLESGWAVDARLARVTREHEDVDVAFPEEKRRGYLAVLRSLGFGRFQETDYGFLTTLHGVVVDSEPCRLAEGAYTFDGFPGGSCPAEKEGIIDGFPVRCLSWEAMYFELLGYMGEKPKTTWRADHLTALAIIERHIPAERRRRLRAMQRKPASRQ